MNGSRDVALLVLRLALGTIMFAHGAQKMLGWYGGPGPEGFVGFMGQMGIPAALAWLAILVEFVGGIAVILGVLARLAALGFAVNMLVAMAMVHWKNGFFMGGERGSGIEFTFMLFAAALAIAIAGPGRYAVAPNLETRMFPARGAPRQVPRAA
jgi:putative oxidoreductase